MASSKMSFLVRTFPRGTEVYAPYKDRECDGMVLEHTFDGQVRVALYTAEEGTNVINLYDAQVLRKMVVTPSAD